MEEIKQQLRRFAAEREWEQFHSPKNLVMALGGEVGELTEHFQWLTEEQSYRLAPETRAEVADELADVFCYLVMLADKLEIDLPAAAEAKIAKNRAKYPVEKAKGRATKYTEL